jgi:hypothetical protein
MKDYAKMIGALALMALTIGLAWAFLIPLFAAGKVVNREAQKFDAETSAQVYDNSRQYQQGINRDVARYCRDLASTEGPARKAVEDLITTTLATYEGPLSDSNQRCAAQIGV